MAYATRGGHRIRVTAYLLLGKGVHSSSTWWLGADREMEGYRILWQREMRLSRPLRKLA